MTKQFPLNKIRIVKNMAFIELINKQKVVKGYAKIDKEDIAKLGNSRWYMSNSGYVVRDSKIKPARLHQLIIGGKKEGLEIDHKNGNRLDNRKKNLRYATHSQNIINSRARKILGYQFSFGRRLKYRVYVCVEGKRIHVGSFETKKDAIRARKKAVKIYYKQFRI